MRKISQIAAVFISISFAGNAQTLTTTNLPIISITTSGAISGSQSQASFKIINNGSGINTPTDAPEYQGMIGIDRRGSVAYPKYSYNIETWLAPFTEVDTPLLGMPTENDWVLLSAYPDRSLMRSLLSLHLWAELGYWAPRMRLCEVLIDGSYQGIYLFGESIKRDNNRLDLSKLNPVDNSGEEVTGGYIFRIDQTNDDSWTSTYSPAFTGGSTFQNIQFHYYYPQDNDITNLQKFYIQSYVDSFENALSASNFQDTTLGWRRFAAHNWFEDYLMVNEITGNDEAYRLNTYLYKDKSKKLRMGPPWSVEKSVYNTADCLASTDTAWMYRHALYCGADTFQPPFWWNRLQQDTLYMKELRCEYSSHRSGGFLDTTSLFGFMDSLSSYMNASGALNRNFQKWPIFGTALVNEPVLSADHAGEVANMKGYLSRRLIFLDGQWLPGACSQSTAAGGGISTFLKDAALVPNPAGSKTELRYNLSKATLVAVSVRNAYGQPVFTNVATPQAAGFHSLSIGISGLPAGVYFVSLISGGETKTLRLLKQ